jgi:hypothetical protein
MTAARIVVPGLLLLGTVAAKAAGPPPLDGYLAAAERGDAGAVAGRAYTERRTPDGPDTPIPNLAVALVPDSAALIAEVEEVKGHARDSMHAYRTAASQVTGALATYARAVYDVGGGGLAPVSLTGADGQFTFSGVPAGEWLLVATHEVTAPIRPPKPRRDDTAKFALPPSLVGYRTVTLWILPVTVTGRGTTTMDVTDRNVWFTGVIEERRK